MEEKLILSLSWVICIRKYRKSRKIDVHEGNIKANIVFFSGGLIIVLKFRLGLKLEL